MRLKWIAVSVCAAVFVSGALAQSGFGQPRQGGPGQGPRGQQGFGRMMGAGMAGMLLVTGDTLNIMSQIGLIMLMGLVTKNAILLVDYTNTLRSRGLPRLQALLEAGPTRLRPILMTTFAMVFGMLPVALAIGRGSEFRAPLGIAVIGGLLLSTLLTLVVIPCVYTVFDDLGNWIARTIFRRGVYRKEELPVREPQVVD